MDVVTVANDVTADAMDDCSSDGLIDERIQEMTICQTYQNWWTVYTKYTYVFLLT